MTIADVLKDLSDNQYTKESKKLTFESKKLVENAIEDIAMLFIHIEASTNEDTVLAFNIFTSAFILGRMYERKLNDPNIYNRTKQ